jgi:ComF family protein
MLRTLTNMLLPPRCVSCRAFGEAPFCAPCARTVEWIDRACARCAAPKRGARDPCSECAERTPGFDAAAAASRYEGPVRDAIVAFKVTGERRIGRVMAGWLLRPARRLSAPGAMTWVPSTKHTVSQRGFVPAEEVARAFARATGRRAVALLRKIRETSDQHGLSAAERFANLAGAFEACRAIAGTVLLVDDVLTTGATAGACAHALRDAGAERVEVLAVARAPLRRRAPQARSISPFPVGEPGARMSFERPSGSVVAARGASRTLSRC